MFYLPKLLADLEEKGSHYHFFFGDETSLGLFHCLKEAVHTQGHEYLGVIELCPEAVDLPEKVGLYVDVALKLPGRSPAEEAVLYLNDLHEALWKNWINASFYLAGSAESIQAFRHALVAKGVNEEKINIYPYWGDVSV